MHKDSKLTEEKTMMTRPTIKHEHTPTSTSDPYGGAFVTTALGDTDSGDGVVEECSCGRLRVRLLTGARLEGAWF